MNVVLSFTPFSIGTEGQAERIADLSDRLASDVPLRIQAVWSMVTTPAR